MMKLESGRNFIFFLPVGFYFFTSLLFSVVG